jgi:hypothetical protein
METRTHDAAKAIRALRQRHPLLDAWLEALNRLESPHCRISVIRHPSVLRRPLIQSAFERHPICRRRSPYPAAAAPGPLQRSR